MKSIIQVTRNLIQPNLISILI
uniref:Uncharacterized protein n=1 Tax=Rhizophora mucronata TaxID=61149 RepID=A0A2P2QIQ3_RHIMU